MLAGVEAMYVIKKEQIDLQDQSVQNPKQFIHQLFGLTGYRTIPVRIHIVLWYISFICTRTVCRW
ncbi:integrase catalytic region [Bacillus thuringiensis Sbt003]|uniref:Integrase catalytic region n=1 Tax=Bacillus thuringiensis Sbt003 TaxID=1235825 RepID=A0A9X0JY04_BACTU|nr:integrase catalytic region [Bacillus thuringiensis Sbt003]